MQNNKEKGFLKIIIIIVIALLLMRYYNISVDDALNWIKSFVNSVVAFFR